jgi:hypothetical protein
MTRGSREEEKKEERRGRKEKIYVDRVKAIDACMRGTEDESRELRYENRSENVCMRKEDVG